jgi:hypothetical protein
MTDLEKAFAQPSLMKVHVSFSGDEFNADLLEISNTGSMTLRTGPTRLNFVSMRYARPIGVTKEIIEKLKAKHWDHEHNHLDIGYLKVYDWLISGLHKTKTSEINAKLTNDEAKLTQVSTTRSDKKIRRKPVELSLNF